MNLVRQKRGRISFVTSREKISKKIFFLHGNSHSLETFSHQLVAEELLDYSVVACDLNGHGASDPLLEYSLISFAKEIANFINTFEIDEYCIVGHSLGGHIFNHLLACEELIKKPSCAAIYGTPPVSDLKSLEECFLPHPALDLLYKNNLNPNELELLAKSFHYSKRNLEKEKEDIGKVDTKFKETFIMSIMEGHFINEVKQLKLYKGKLAILHGEFDGLINIEYIKKLDLPLWGGSIQIVPNSGHNIHSDTPEKFNSIIQELCEENL